MIDLLINNHVGEVIEKIAEITQLELEKFEEDQHFEAGEDGINFDIFYDNLSRVIESKQSLPKESNNKKQKNIPTQRIDFSQNLISTISQYEGLVASLSHDDPMRKAYRDVIDSLRKQLIDATQSQQKDSKNEKQLSINQSFNQLSVSEIITHPQTTYGDGFNDREIDKSFEDALNTNALKNEEIKQQEEEEFSDEDYETELEELYTAYSNQYIREETFNLFETQYHSKKGLNVGKFGKFCSDYGCKINIRKISEIYNKLAFSSSEKVNLMTFAGFKKALRRIPLEENVQEISELKFDFK